MALQLLLRLQLLLVQGKPLTDLIVRQENMPHCNFETKPRALFIARVDAVNPTVGLLEHDTRDMYLTTTTKQGI